MALVIVWETAVASWYWLFHALPLVYRDAVDAVSWCMPTAYKGTRWNSVNSNLVEEDPQMQAWLLVSSWTTSTKSWAPSGGWWGKVGRLWGRLQQSFLEFRFRYRRALTANSTYQARGPALPFAAILTSIRYLVPWTSCVPGPGQRSWGGGGKAGGWPGSTFANSIMNTRWNFLSCDRQHWNNSQQQTGGITTWRQERREPPSLFPLRSQTRKGKGSRPATSTSWATGSEESGAATSSHLPKRVPRFLREGFALSTSRRTGRPSCQVPCTLLCSDCHPRSASRVLLSQSFNHDIS